MRISKNQPDLTLIDFRDGQQSALDFKDINFNSKDWAKALSKAAKAGFKTAEVAGGQNFQSAIKNGYNPIAFLESLGLARMDQDGRKAIDFQMLFRAANGLGFKHYPPKIIDVTLKEFTQVGNDKVRFFDALNDIDDIYIPDFIKDDPAIVKQGGLCFGRYENQPQRYTDKYYANYAKALVEKGNNSIAIKDMSGQLDAERIATLLPALRKALKEVSPNKKIPVELHIHSTNKSASLGAIREAIRLGIDAIETIEGPLSGGAAHNSIDAINSDGKPHVNINTDAHAELKQSLDEVFGDVKTGKIKRSDLKIPSRYRDKLCAAGVPGGAMPVVLANLRNNLPLILMQNPQYFTNESNLYKAIGFSNAAINDAAQFSTLRNDTNKNLSQIIKSNPEKFADDQNFEKAIDLFIEELGRVCRDANYPLLVTPTADICTTQAILNMQWRDISKDTLEARYGNFSKGIDSRFVKLLLGHYGRMREYSDSRSLEFHKPEQSVIDFFNGKKLPDGKTFEAIYDQQHPYIKMLEERDNGEYDKASAKAKALYEKYGFKAKSFATLDQLTVMYAIQPYCNGDGDSIEPALKAYIQRMQKTTAEKYKVALPLDINFAFVVQPLLDHLEAIIAFGRKALPENPLDITLKEFAGVGERIYETYKGFIRKNELKPAISSFNKFKEFKLGSFISSLMKQVQKKALQARGKTFDLKQTNAMIENFLARVRDSLQRVK